MIDINNVPLEFRLSILGIGVTGHALYAFATQKEKSIIIVKKYTYCKNGFTDFMIIDKNGNHYNVNNSFWYYKWNSIEDWSNIGVNQLFHIKYYGWRIPILGCFPNIYFSSNDQNLQLSYNSIAEQNYYKKLQEKEKDNNGDADIIFS